MISYSIGSSYPKPITPNHGLIFDSYQGTLDMLFCQAVIMFVVRYHLPEKNALNCFLSAIALQGTGGLESFGTNCKTEQC